MENRQRQCNARSKQCDDKQGTDADHLEPLFRGVRFTFGRWLKSWHWLTFGGCAAGDSAYGFNIRK